MIRGLFTIEIVNKNTGDVKVIKKENAVNPYYKKMFNIGDFPNNLTLPSEAETPLTNGFGGIIAPDYIMFSSGTYPSELPNISISHTNETIDVNGRHIFFSTDYLDGSFVLRGIITSRLYGYNDYPYSYKWRERLFSCLDITPAISITNEEKVKFNYELILEW